MQQLLFDLALTPVRCDVDLATPSDRLCLHELRLRAGECIAVSLSDATAAHRTRCGIGANGYEQEVVVCFDQTERFPQVNTISGGVER